MSGPQLETTSAAALEAEIRAVLGGWDRPSQPLSVAVLNLVRGAAELERKRDQLRETRRDEFAAAALQGLLSSPRRWECDGQKVTKPAGYASLAYRIANAMMKARG